MNHIIEQLDKMRTDIKKSTQKNAGQAQENAVYGEELSADLDYFTTEIYGLIYALNKAESERDLNNNLYNEAQKQKKKLENEETQRKEDEFREMLIAVTQNSSLPSCKDHENLVNPVNPVQVRAPNNLHS